MMCLTDLRAVLHISLKPCGSTDCRSRESTPTLVTTRKQQTMPPLSTVQSTAVSATVGSRSMPTATTSRHFQVPPWQPGAAGGSGEESV
ncbi:hypothetical protein E2562_022727 [Oryza meyeriana var. granulata]|uniref:Uncharacterized protein n=1 Tax=Oryza meyeriana var. granulata TaxID=110450 RepID=A0A6G1FAX0_9ORYZ|nr:hypothetical protein E2562_022727 [Oryza meyeriana var. granulata]